MMGHYIRVNLIWPMVSPQVIVLGVRVNDKKTRRKKNMSLASFATPKMDVKSCSKESLQERGKTKSRFQL
jgi:hypothetical protein